MSRILLAIATVGVLFGSIIFFSANSFLRTDVVYAQAPGDTGGLVPCGHGNDEANRCTLCDLFVGIDRIIDWGRTILVAVALTALVAGGIMYIVSAGNQQMMETAKTLIKQALIGTAIVLGAWLIVSTVMWLIATKGDLGVQAGPWFNFSCEGGVAGSSSGAGANTGAGTGGVDTPDTENYYRTLLAENGISINHQPCTGGQTSGCTNVGGLRDDTLQGVVDLAHNSGANIVINAGSEGGHSNRTEYSHANGYKVDIAPNSEIDGYITSHFERVGVRSDGATVYRDGNNYYAREGSHWDVCYNCPSPIPSR